MITFGKGGPCLGNLIWISINAEDLKTVLLSEQRGNGSYAAADFKRVMDGSDIERFNRLPDLPEVPSAFDRAIDE